MLKKIFSYLAASLFLLFFFTPSSLYAQETSCPLTLSQNAFPFNFNAEITATLTEGCIPQSGTSLYINYRPVGETAVIGMGGYQNVTVEPPTQIRFRVNINDVSAAAKETPNWELNFCKNVSNCQKGDSNFIGQTAITVSQDAPEPTQALVSGLPIIHVPQQATCYVQGGKEISFWATNVDPTKSYNWFYPSDDGIGSPLEKGTCGPDGPNGDSKCTRSGQNLTFTLKAEDTEGPARKERVCLDVDNSYRSNTTQNCIEFTVQNTPIDPKADVSCQAFQEKESVADATPTPPHPPCPDEFISRGPNNEFIGCSALFTGLGIPISTNPTEFISDIFAFLLSISGGILLLLIIFSGYQFMTSQGNPEKIQAARERLISAIAGFLFLVLSLVILEVIGVDILRIPGFYKSNQTPVNRDGLNSPNTPRQNERTPF